MAKDAILSQHVDCSQQMLRSRLSQVTGSGGRARMGSLAAYVTWTTRHAVRDTFDPYQCMLRPSYCG
jgi:hypothetical protein